MSDKTENSNHTVYQMGYPPGSTGAVEVGRDEAGLGFSPRTLGNHGMFELGSNRVRFLL